MKQERWEIRSTEKILHFFSVKSKNKGLISLPGINQSSAIVKKMRWKWNFFTTAKCLIILWILSIHPTYTCLSFIQSLYLHFFFFFMHVHTFSPFQVFLPEMQHGFSVLIASSALFMFPACTVSSQFSFIFHADLWQWQHMTPKSQSRYDNSDIAVVTWDNSNKPCRITADIIGYFLWY